MLNENIKVKTDLNKVTHTNITSKPSLSRAIDTQGCKIKGLCDAANYLRFYLPDAESTEQTIDDILNEIKATVDLMQSMT